MAKNTEAPKETEKTEAPKPKTCRMCTAVNKPGAKVCRMCGAKL